MKNAAKIQRNIIVNYCVLHDYIKWWRFCTKCRWGSMKHKFGGCSANGSESEWGRYKKGDTLSGISFILIH